MKERGIFFAGQARVLSAVILIPVCPPWRLYADHTIRFDHAPQGAEATQVELNRALKSSCCNCDAKTYDKTFHRKVYFIILLRYDLNNMRDLYTTWEFAGFVFVLLYVLDEDDYSYISY